MLHLSAAAGVSAARRAKSGDGRAAKLFFARGTFGDCWKCSDETAEDERIIGDTKSKSKRERVKSNAAPTQG